jgi:hypothetical protein
MRFLITAGPGEDEHKPEPDAPFDEALFAAYMKFNEELTKAGVLVVAEGLSPSGSRARVVTSRGRRKVVDGPFTEAKELVGGFYLIEVASKEEAIEWALRCPTGLGFDDELRIYQMTELSDLPPRFAEIIHEVAPTWIAAATAPPKR